MKFNTIEIPSRWEHYWTKYPEGYTIIEALLDWVKHVNDLTENVNSLNDYIEGFVETFEKSLQETISITLSEWYESGFLAEIINENVFNMKADKEELNKFGILIGERLEGESNDDGAFQRAIEKATQTGNHVIVLHHEQYEVSKVELVSDLTFISYNRSKVTCLDSGIESHATFVAKYPASDLSNIHFKGIVFDGNRENIPSLYNHIIGLWVENGQRLDNFSVENCEFFDAKEDFIRITGKDSNAKADHIRIHNNKFYGTSGATTDYAGNAIRVVLYRYTPENYDYEFATSIQVTNNYAENIRTLADLKRGCSQFVIAGNQTKNMFDIDLSVDGAKHGEIYANIQRQDETFATNGQNAIEIQGEHIGVFGNQIQYKALNGILITDYGHPDEGNVYHASKHIHVHGNQIEKVGSCGVKAVNGDEITVQDNFVHTSGNVVVIDEITTHRGKDGAALSSGHSFVANNTYNETSWGFNVKGSKPIFGHGNVGEQGQTKIVYNDSLIVLPQHDELNPNVHLEIEGTLPKHFTTGDTVVAASTKPVGSLQAITLQDNSPSSLAEVNLGRTVPCKKGDILHFSLYTKKGTAPNCSIIIKEQTGTTWVSSYFNSIYPTSEWKRTRFTYLVANEATDNIAIAFSPAASHNAVANTGTNDFAYFQIGKQPIA